MHVYGYRSGFHEKLEGAWAEHQCNVDAVEAKA